MDMEIFTEYVQKILNTDCVTGWIDNSQGN